MDRFNPPISFWNSDVPKAIVTDLPSKRNWTNPTNWNLHCYHPSLWGNWGFSIKDYVESNTTILFNKGGFQEARGGDYGIGNFYIDGIFEELDSENEFYFDNVENKLYWVPP